MNNSTNEAQINFRFMRLDKMQAFTLVREITGSFYEEDTSRQCFIAYVPLTDSNLDEINDFYVRQRVEIEHCDIFIETNKDLPIKTCRVPTIVNTMLKYIDCQLTLAC